jgi:hypothetical protein
VVEHCLDGDVGARGDVRDRHRLEAVLREQVLSDELDLLSRLGLLARTTVL